MEKAFFKPDKHNMLYIVLSGIFIANALIAEMVGVKIFTLGNLFGKFDLNLSVGVLIWPFVFVFSDIINEYFGKEGVRKLSFFTAGLISYSFLIVFIGTGLSPAKFWIENNHLDPAGNIFNINYAYSAIFRQSLGIIVGSISAFLISQLIDTYSFLYIKKFTGHRWLWLRATGSTVISQMFDSFVILFIAFYLLGNWSFNQVIAVGIVQYFYKIGIAILLTPILYLVHYIIDWYLGTSAEPNLNHPTE
jgi:queuosine precursor transporter